MRTGRGGRFRGALWCVALIGSIAGCARSGEPGDAPARATTLRLYVPKSPSTLNPLLTTTITEADLGRLAFDTLIVPDERAHLRPGLARIVPTRANGGISADGKTVTFRLRKNVRWHDGAAFTSADVAFTFAQIANPKVNISSRTGYDRIVRVETPDAYTAVVHLREPFAPFVAYAGYQYPIVPKHLLAHSADINRDPIGLHPIGTGPYRFVRWEHGSRIEYAANHDYFGGAPAIEHLRVAEIADQNTVALELRTHQLDFGALEPSTFAQLRDVPDVRLATEPHNDFTSYALNVESPMLRDVRVRRAVAMALDRAALVRAATYGTGTVAYADLPPLLWAAHEPRNPYGYDRAAANALLDAAGWRRDATGTRARAGVTLRLRGVDISGDPTYEHIDVAAQQMLHAVGIDLSVKYYSPSLYYEPRAAGGPVTGGRFDIAMYGFFAGVDPQDDEIYTCANRPPNGYNFALYCSARMDALQHDALTTLDPAHRRADVARIERLAATDVPYIFLYHTPWLLAAVPGLHRTHTTLENQWNDIAHWSLTRP